MKKEEGFRDEIDEEDGDEIEEGMCPDCGGIMDYDEPLFFCDHCCIIYEWCGCYYDYIGSIDNCW